MPPKHNPAPGRLAKHAPEPHETQLELLTEFQLGAPHLSRVLPLWDLLPLYLFARQNEVPPDTPVAKVVPRKHEFTHRDGRIGVEVRPAIISRGDGERSRMVFPGEREQLVASALRALGVRGAAALGTQPPKKGRVPLVTIAFTIRQLRAELASTRHTFSFDEVVEALDILSKTGVTVTQSAEGGEPINHVFNFFEGVTSQGEKRLVILNALESQQIMAGAYRALDYAEFMALGDPLSRWLYQYVHTEARGAQKPVLGQPMRPFTITLDLLYERGVIHRPKELRKSILRVRKALSILAGSGVLHTEDGGPGYSEELTRRATGGRAQIVGAAWHLYLSADTVDAIIDAHAEARPRGDAFSHVPVARRLEIAAQARQNLSRKRSRTG